MRHGLNARGTWSGASTDIRHLLSARNIKALREGLELRPLTESPMRVGRRKRMAPARPYLLASRRATLSATAFSFGSVTIVPFTAMRMTGLWWYPPTSTARVVSE